jgi:hypothetical protein
MLVKTNKAAGLWPVNSLQISAGLRPVNSLQTALKSLHLCRLTAGYKSCNILVSCDLRLEKQKLICNSRFSCFTILECDFFGKKTLIFYSYGERQVIACLLRKLQHQSKEQLRQRKPEMIASLKKLGDFVVDLKWDFTSWLPLVSRILPSDICKISKKGASIRLDTTLVDFTEMRWERGDITFLYKGDAATPEESLFVMDNKLRVYQKVG